MLVSLRDVMLKMRLCWNQGLISQEILDADTFHACTMFKNILAGLSYLPLV
jgi:hypothetical protein